MTNPTSPVAPPAVGSPNDKMPDMIDSLRRLERIGSEHSKTVQKLLEAAKEIERVIGEAYLSVAPSVDFFGHELLKELADGLNCPIETVAAKFGINVNDVRGLAYRITHTAAESSLSENAMPEQFAICEIQQPNLRISESREAALRFASGIATKGLIKLLVENLELRQMESDLGLDTLGSAKKVIEKEFSAKG